MTGSKRLQSILLPAVVAVGLLCAWHATIRLTKNELFPVPLDVLHGIVELARKGLLAKYIVASLYRVTWGFFGAVLIGVPFGMVLGWFGPMFNAFNPIVQALRPISPIAWIPLAILWFGVTDMSTIFLIFLASVFPIIVSTTAAVKNINPVYVRSARNFGLTRVRLFAQVIFPAVLPQTVTTAPKKVPTGLSVILWRWVDAGFIDGIVNGVASLTGGVSQRLRKVQTGVVSNYALAIALGTVLIVGVYLVFGPQFLGR